MKVTRFAKLLRIRPLTGIRTFALFGGVWLAASLPVFAEVRVTIHDGLVTVVAKDATIRQILSEWARVGQARVVNGERIAGGPISLELTNVPEQQALDLLLRSVSGYIAAPRPTISASLSRYDRVIVMPASPPPRAATTTPPPTVSSPPPQFQPPLAQPGGPGGAGIPTIPDDDGDDERPQPNGIPTRGPVFQTFPQPQVVNPSQPLPIGAAPFQPPPVQPQQPAGPAPAPFPTAPFGGVAVPGMVAPAPQPPPNQPGVMTAPGQVPTPQTPRRPEGRQ
jgi:hypothetical protein